MNADNWESQNVKRQWLTRPVRRTKYNKIRVIWVYNSDALTWRMERQDILGGGGNNEEGNALFWTLRRTMYLIRDFNRLQSGALTMEETS